MGSEIRVNKFQAHMKSDCGRGIMRFDILMEQNLPPGARLLVVNRPVKSSRLLAPLFAGDPFRLPPSELSPAPAPHRTVIPVERCLAMAANWLQAGKAAVIFTQAVVHPWVSQPEEMESKTGIHDLLSAAPVIPVGIHPLWRAAPLKGKKAGGPVWWCDLYVTVGRPLVLDGDVGERLYWIDAGRRVLAVVMALAGISACRSREANTLGTPAAAAASKFVERSALLNGYSHVNLNR